LHHFQGHFDFATLQGDLHGPVPLTDAERDQLLLPLRDRLGNRLVRLIDVLPHCFIADIPTLLPGVFYALGNGLSLEPQQGNLRNPLGGNILVDLGHGGIVTQKGAEG
jgi:hypothetical protein